MCGLSCAAPLSFVLLHWELCVWWSQFVYISSQYRVCNTYPTVLDCAFCAELRVMDLKTLSYIHLCPLSILKKHVKTTSIPYDTTNLYWGSFFHRNKKTFSGENICRSRYVFVYNLAVDFVLSKNKPPKVNCRSFSILPISWRNRF